MTGLREKFKATKVSSLKKKISEEDKIAGSGDRAGFLSIDEGSNKFRIMPPHPGSGDFYVLNVRHWLDVENKDGKMGRKPVFNAKIHGGFKRDIVEEYMLAAKKMLEENEDSDAALKIAAMSDYKTGLKASTNWTCYALKISGEDAEFGILEMNRSVRDGINNISVSEDDDEPIETDPFTDPDTGIPVIIKYDSKAKDNRNKYSVTLGRKPEPRPLTDEEIEDFSKQPSLLERYRNCYTVKDFEIALNGVRNFDEKNEIGFCDTDDFEELAAELLAEVQKGGKKEKKSIVEPEKTKERVQKKPKVEKRGVEEEEEEEEEEVEEESTDSLDSMSREELKRHIKSNNLDVRVKTNMVDEEIREAIRRAQEEDTKDEEEEEEEEDDEKPTTGSSMLAQIKRNILANKGKK